MNDPAKSKPILISSLFPHKLTTKTDEKWYFHTYLIAAAVISIACAIILRLIIVGPAARIMTAHVLIECSGGQVQIV